MAEIHNIKKRMPFILDREGASTWILHDLTKEEISSQIKQFPSERMFAQAV